ncbi:hypothetical protein [Corynebacterium sputi]|uniref:hypothetical protein n=1 Tax=Corynebacterium sputi TaxID=489915 RepID=UPI0004791989|nr:hypothetical protein [Corynebacterium sputi]
MNSAKTAGSRDTLARRISDITSPVWVVAVMAVIFGALTGDLVVGIVIGALSGVIPGIAIMVKQRRGSISSGWHVTDRAERAGVFVIILMCLVLLGIFVAVADVPQAVIGLVAAEFSVVIFSAVLTLIGHKPSMHVAVWLGGWAAVAMLQPWFILMVLLTPVVAWARIRIAHHTLRQVLAGAAVAVATLPVFLLAAGFLP